MHCMYLCKDSAVYVLVYLQYNIFTGETKMQ